RYPEAALYHGRLQRPGIDDPAGAHLQRSDDPAPRQTLATTPLSRLWDRDLRRGAFLLVGQSRHPPPGAVWRRAGLAVRIPSRRQTAIDSKKSSFESCKVCSPKYGLNGAKRSNRKCATTFSSSCARSCAAAAPSYST